MKLLLVVLLLSGCTITPTQWSKCEKICQPHGGIKEFQEFGRVCACNVDNVTAYLQHE